MLFVYFLYFSIIYRDPQKPKFYQATRPLVLGPASTWKCSLRGHIWAPTWVTWGYRVNWGVDRASSRVVCSEISCLTPTWTCCHCINWRIHHFNTWFKRISSSFICIPFLATSIAQSLVRTLPGEMILLATCVECSLASSLVSSSSLPSSFSFASSFYHG